MGTRPEIIKMWPIVQEYNLMDLEYFILHSGQHYSQYMDRVFFEQLGITTAKYNLDVGSGSHAEQTGKILVGVEKVLSEEMPDIVLVQGDTNTTLAAALAACKMGIPVGHVEAGLRSYDRNMPEEINRVLTDHCSEFLFAPTEKSKNILLQEGIPQEKIFLTGNTIVDAVYQNLEKAKKSDIIKELGLSAGKYFLVTVHRQENVDSAERFGGILKGFEMLQEELGFPIIYPIHPRAKKQKSTFKIKTKNIRFISPLDYFNFLQLENNSRLILTDSGGLQEEACILGVPCVTLRYNTERPETIDVGANILAGTGPQEIVQKTRYMLKKKGDWENPFGDGRAGKNIVKIIQNKLG